MPGFGGRRARVVGQLKSCVELHGAEHRQQRHRFDEWHLQVREAVTRPLDLKLYLFRSLVRRIVPQSETEYSTRGWRRWSSGTGSSPMLHELPVGALAPVVWHFAFPSIGADTSMVDEPGQGVPALVPAVSA